jgi:hypothetical protein
MSRLKTNPTPLVLLAALAIFATFAALHSFVTPVSAQTVGECALDPACANGANEANGDNGNQNDPGNIDNNP